MRLVLFDDYRLGALARGGDVVVPIDDLLGPDLPSRPQDRVVGVIERWVELRPQLEGRVAAVDGLPIADVRLRPPLPRPGKIVCAIAKEIFFSLTRLCAYAADDSTTEISFVLPSVAGLLGFNR